MSKALRDTDYLQHMLQAIERINRYVTGIDEARFLRDDMLQDAVIRNIEIIGEAANRLSSEFTSAHDALPWRDIAGMRHRLIHGYLSVNLATVWNTVQKDLPGMELRCRTLLNELEGNS